MIVIVQEGQNLNDITVQEFGDIEFKFRLLEDNNLSNSSKLQAGQELLINNLNLGNKDIKDYIYLKNLKLNNAQNEKTPEGYGGYIPPGLGGGVNNDYSNDFD